MGLVLYLNALTHSGIDYGMVPDNIPGPYSMHGDIPSGVIGNNLGQFLGRPRWRVLLGFMVGLYHLNIIAGPEFPGNLAHYAKKQVYPHSHIGREYYRNGFGGILNFSGLFLI